MRSASTYIQLVQRRWKEDERRKRSRQTKGKVTSMHQGRENSRVSTDPIVSRQPCQQVVTPAYRSSPSLAFHLPIEGLHDGLGVRLNQGGPRLRLGGFLGLLRRLVRRIGRRNSSGAIALRQISGLSRGSVFGRARRSSSLRTLLIASPTPLPPLAVPTLPTALALSWRRIGLPWRWSGLSVGLAPHVRRVRIREDLARRQADVNEEPIGSSTHVLQRSSQSTKRPGLAMLLHQVQRGGSGGKGQPDVNRVVIPPSRSARGAGAVSGPACLLPG